jgi:uncharacterized protein with HEPN domain
VPRRETDERLRDILAAIAKIRRYTAGMDFRAFADDEKTIDAVIRNFAVIGEAANHLSDDYIGRHSGIPWDEMRGMRNVIIHEYFGVSMEIIWETIQGDLPAVEESLRAHLAGKREL